MSKRKIRSFKCHECGGITEPAIDKKEAIINHFLNKHKHIVRKEIYNYHKEVETPKNEETSK